jgi:hypothetical protein
MLPSTIKTLLLFTRIGQLPMSLFLMADMGCQGLRAMPENLRN